jgi:hypothetical protein
MGRRRAEEGDGKEKGVRTGGEEGYQGWWTGQERGWKEGWQGMG